MNIAKDKYGSLIIDCIDPAFDCNTIRPIICDLLQADNRIIWVHLINGNVHLLPAFLDYGFIFHSCAQNEILIAYSRFSLPGEGKFYAAAGGVLLRDSKVLVVKEKHEQREGFYKLPGGFVKQNELISCAVEREYKEETNIDVSFDSLLSIGQFTTTLLNSNCIYFVCKVHQQRECDIFINAEEIESVKWINVDDFIYSMDTSSFNKEAVQNALTGVGMRKRLFSSNGINPVPIESYFSIEKEE